LQFIINLLNQKEGFIMANLDRRTFMKYLGGVATALGIGGISTRSFAAEADKTASKIKTTVGKYQTFNKGKWLAWEKEAIEERLKQAAAAAPGGVQANKDVMNEIINPLAAGKGGKGGAVGAVTEEELLAYAKTWDPYNPLFNNPDYARKAGYPNIPALPNCKSPMGSGAMGLTIPKNFADSWYYANDGSDLHYYRHIFPGDVLTTKSGKTGFIELTEDGSDLRHFQIVSEAEMYNAKGELTATSKGSLRNAYRKIIDGSKKMSFTENMTEWTRYFPEGHYTTDEEWAQIRQMWKNEKIRGAEKLYWEDVKVGDEPTPVCTGPVSWMDMAAWHGCQNTSPRGGGMVKGDPTTEFRDKFGIFLPETAMHYGGRNIPGGRAVLYNHTAATHIMRLVTNYIGDAGLVTRFKWTFKQLFKEMQVEKFQGGEFMDLVPSMKGRTCDVHPAEGDTIIGKGSVTKKYKNEKGEGIIDITVWAETFDKKIIQIVAASAKLPLKKA
jgi:hypothetical protein